MFKKNYKKEFYVYIYLNPLKTGRFIYDKYSFEFEPFYVGKGKSRRLLDHLINKEGSEEKIFLIEQLLEIDKPPMIIKIKEKLLEDEAFELEKEVIKIIGRKILKEGPLLNIQPGGEGFSGWIITENWLEKNKQAQIERWKKASLEYRKRHGEKIRKAFDNPETKKKLSDISKERWKNSREEMLSYQRDPNVKRKKSQATINGLSKTYILISPNGDRYKTNRLKDFCKEYNLNGDLLQAISNGKHITYKGWICFKEGKEKETLEKIEELKKLKIERKLQQNLSQTGKHIHTKESKEKIGNASKGNKHGLGYRHTPESLKKIGDSSKKMWQKRKNIMED